MKSLILILIGCLCALGIAAPKQDIMFNGQDNWPNSANTLSSDSKLAPNESIIDDTPKRISAPIFELPTDILRKTETYPEPIDDAPEKCFSLDPFMISNFTVEDYDKILQGTGMEGLGYFIENMEFQYHVNGMFCLGVARAESGLGKSDVAKEKNNFFGIMGLDGCATFNTPEECIDFFGQLMNSERYLGKSIEEIAPTYCNEAWGDFVIDCMYYNYNLLED